ncbi:MAG: hypothetical protein AABW68_00755 [archaeon]
MVSHHHEGEVESDSLRVLGVCAFFLLVFALAFWVVNPSAQVADFSTLEWTNPPFLQWDGNVSVVEWGVLLSSFEDGNQSYAITSFVGGRESESRDVGLASGLVERLDFAIPLDSSLVFPIEIRVRVEKVDANGIVQVPVPLELVDWVRGE